MKTDRESGLPLIGVTTGLEEIQACVMRSYGAQAEKIEERQAGLRGALRVMELRRSCGVDPGTITFRRHVPFKT